MTMTVDDILRKYQDTESRKAPEESDVKADLLDLRNSQKADAAAITPHTDQQPVVQINYPGHHDEDLLSVERKKQMEFCQILWEGACEKVAHAKVEAGMSQQTVSEDSMFLEKDIALRRKIFDQLQNPHVNFRNFALLVYRWRDMHLNRVMPKKQTLSIPSWQTLSYGTRGENEGKHES